MRFKLDTDELELIVNHSHYPVTFSGDVPNFLTKWLVRSVSDPMEDSLTLASPILLEHEVSFASQQQRENSWRYYKSADGRENLLESMFQIDEDKRIYCLCSIYSPVEQEVFIFTRSSLPVTVWLNGHLINHSTFQYHVKPFQIIARLKQGVNTILLERAVNDETRSLPEGEYGFTISYKPVSLLLEMDREQLVFTPAKLEEMKSLYYVLPDRPFCTDKRVSCLILPYDLQNSESERLKLEVRNRQGLIWHSNDVYTGTPVNIDLSQAASGVVELIVSAEGNSAEGALSNAYIFIGDYEAERECLLERLAACGMGSDQLELYRYMLSLAMNDKGLNHGKVELHYDRIYYHLLREYEDAVSKLEALTESRPQEAGADAEKFSPRGIKTALSTSSIDGAKLAYTVFLPRNYKREEAFPLVFCMPFGTMVNTVPEGTDEMYHNRFEDVIWACMYARGGYNKDYINEMDIMRFIEEIIQDYGVDRDRVYLMGVCSGALRIFGLATRFPGKFAAVVNIVGTFRADINNPDYSILENLGTTPVYQLLNIEDDIFNTTRILQSSAYMPQVKNVLYNHFSHKEAVEVFQSREVLRLMQQHTRDRNPREIVFHMHEPIYNTSYWLKIEAVADVCQRTIVRAAVRSGEIVVDTDQARSIRLLIDRNAMDLGVNTVLRVNGEEAPVKLYDYSLIRIQLAAGGEKMRYTVEQLGQIPYELMREKLEPDQGAMGIKAVYADKCTVIVPEHDPNKKRYIRTMTHLLQQPLRERARNYKYMLQHRLDEQVDALENSHMVYYHDAEFDSCEELPFDIGALQLKLFPNKLVFQGRSYQGEYVALIRTTSYLNPGRYLLLVIVNGSVAEQQLLDLFNSYDSNPMFYCSAILWNEGQFHYFNHERVHAHANANGNE